MPGQERKFPASERLISSTDRKGRIVHCNKAFEEISGYSREELIGRPHNIIRHPDMPKLAFKTMWEHLKDGKPWMGLVKNRCKNGDYYWVNAYVTPITENGEIIGYESVRSCPSRADVSRAERLYRKINKTGFKYGGVNFIAPENIYLAIALIGAMALVAFDQTLASTLWLGIATLGYGLWSTLRRRKIYDEIGKLLDGAFKHELAICTHTDSNSDLGRLQVAIMSERAHLDTVMTRIDDAAERVSAQAKTGLIRAEEAHSGMHRQQLETERVVTAMQEMTKAITALSHHVQETASNAEHASNDAEQGRRIAEVTRRSIEHLSHTVDAIGDSVGVVSTHITKIAKAAMVIEEIAEQTNLLSLNAAIEAARAGDHGRGFAIVAQEVRTLAQNTRDSTSEIHQLITELTSSAEQAVEVAQTGKKEASDGLSRVQETEQKLADISASLNHISDMAQQMAAAIEEESLVASDVNQQTENIAALADDGMTISERTADSIRGVQEVARQLRELVRGFKR